jgi:hypothetical protein
MLPPPYAGSGRRDLQPAVNSAQLDLTARRQVEEKDRRRVFALSTQATPRRSPWRDFEAVDMRVGVVVDVKELPEAR